MEEGFGNAAGNSCLREKKKQSLPLIELVQPLTHNSATMGILSQTLTFRRKQALLALDRYKTLCFYAFRHGVSLRAQTPNAPQNTKTLFDSGLLYLSAIYSHEPSFLNEVTALALPDDVALALGGKFPGFDAKAYLTDRAEARRLEEKAKAKKPFGAT